MLYNCTLTQNVAYENDCDEVGAIDYYMSAYNCIVWANVTDNGRSADITDAWGEYYGDNVNNYESDPNFVDAENGDYRLAANSPCIDMGDNTYVVGDKDLNDSTRIVNGKVDIGCYEYQGDVVTKCTVTFDAAGGTAEWTKGEVVEGAAVGTLPTATRDGYEFLGWFTAAVGGTQVTAATVVTEDVTFYAQWKLITFSETVGEITWTYLLRDGVAVVDNNGNAAVSGKVEGEVVVPATLGGYPVAAIGAGAFRDCADLTAVVLPQCVTALGEAAFRGCSNLVSVAIPEGVTSIPARAFMGCAALEELAIPAGVTDIGEEAFADCASLKAVDIPAGVAEIAARTFVGCAALGKVALPEDLVRIDAGAFAGCAALGSVSVPSGVVALGEGAFAGCKGLSSASFAGQPPAGIRESGLLDGKTRINGPAQTLISPTDRTVFATELAVTLSTEWPDGVVRYTLDGTEPTAESPEFEGISVHNKTTVRAATFVDGLRWGEIAEATYGVGKVATPVIASESGDTFYHNDNLVSLSCETKGVEIRYTLNGGEPTASSALYTAPFAISQTTIVKAKAFGHPDYVDSDTATRQLVRAWEGLATPVISPAGGEYQSEWQEVSIACESEGVTVYYTLDGSRPSAANGLAYKGPFRVYRTQTVKAVATRYDWQDSEIARADFTRANALSEAVNCYGVLAKTDEAHPWTVDAANSHDGVGSARSASVEDGTSFMSLTVKGAGRLTFWWRASCEEEWEGEYYDYGSFKVGGTEQAKICGKTGWLKVSVDIKGTGKNTLKWEYAKDGETDEGEDCIWVDRVVWVPADGNGATLTSGEPVPYAWLEEYGLGADSDFETAANARTGKRGALGRELAVWEDYVAGTNPTNEDSVFRAHIDMSGDKPKITWTPDLNEGGTKDLRVYRTFGAKTPDGQWFEVKGDEEKYNFFKVSVEMR